MLLIVAFGVATLALATFGFYGLVAYLVAQRTKEMGIRMALGATHNDLLRLIVGRGCVLALVGSGVGGAATVPLTQLVKGMFFSTSPTDPVVLWSVVAITIGAATAASYLPARRAARREPIVSLRTQ